MFLYCNKFPPQRHSEQLHMHDVCRRRNDIYFVIIDKSQKIIDINHEI